MLRTRVLAGTVAVAGTLALLSGCTSHSAKPGAANPSSTSTSTSTSVGAAPGASGGAVPSASGSAAGSALSYPNQAEAYTGKAIAAWRGHDATVLGSLNAPSDTVFTTLDGGRYDNHFDTLSTCEGAAGSTYCTYYNSAGDTLRLQVRNDLLGKPHAIVGGQLIPITFPTDYRAYAQETLTAWQGHNTAAVSLLTGKSGDSAFASVPASARTADWSFDHDEGATGHELFYFHDSAGNTLGFAFSNPDFVSPPANRHGLVEQIAYTPHS